MKGALLSSHAEILAGVADVQRRSAASLGAIARLNEALPLAEQLRTLATIQRSLSGVLLELSEGDERRVRRIVRDYARRQRAERGAGSKALRGRTTVGGVR